MNSFSLIRFFSNFCAEEHYLVIPYNHHEDYVNCDELVLKKAFEIAFAFIKEHPVERLKENYSLKLNYTTDEQIKRIQEDPVKKPEKLSTKESTYISYFEESNRQKIRHAHLHIMMGCARNWNKKIPIVEEKQN